jgi:uncharacterized protein (DUF1919 family)
MNTLEEKEEMLSYKEMQTIKKNLSEKNLNDITDDERSLMILNYYSLAFIQLGALIDATACLKILGYEKELEFKAKHSKKEARKRDFYLRLKKMNTDALFIKNNITSIFSDSSLPDLLISSNEELEAHFNRLALMPYPKRVLAIRVIEQIEKDETIIDVDENPDIKELVLLYSKANVKKDFVSHCISYFEF